MDTDLLVPAVAQLASIMIATWSLTEQIGNRLLTRIGKFWIALVLGPALTVAAYGVGFFTALPETATLRAIPMTGPRGYLAAAFAGAIASILTSSGHALLIGSGVAKSPGGGQ